MYFLLQSFILIFLHSFSFSLFFLLSFIHSFIHIFPNYFFTCFFRHLFSLTIILYSFFYLLRHFLLPLFNCVSFLFCPFVSLKKCHPLFRPSFPKFYSFIYLLLLPANQLGLNLLLQYLYDPHPNRFPFISASHSEHRLFLFEHC